MSVYMTSTSNRNNQEFVDPEFEQEMKHILDSLYDKNGKMKKTPSEERAIQLFQELSNHDDMKTLGFKFVFAKDHPAMQQVLDLVSGYQIICNPPEIGFITKYPFTCEVLETDEILISLEGVDVENFDGPYKKGTKYMSYKKKIFKTNKDVIQQFEKIVASKSIEKIKEIEIHKRM